MDLEKCPFCGANVKTGNLREHYARVHPKRLGTLTRPQTIQAPRLPRGKSHRKMLLALLVVVLLTGVTVYALRLGGQSLTVAVSPSTLSIAGPGIVAFDVTLTPQRSLSSEVVLRLENRPTWVSALFDPSRLSMSGNPASSRVTLVVENAFASGTYPMRVVADVGSGVAEATVSLQISNPSPSKPFYLMASSSGWNSTEPSGPNPPIMVQKGETFNLTLVLVSQADFHHYISIYPSGTLPSQVSEFSTLAYARSDLAHEYPGRVTITFTSEITGTLEYYCDVIEHSANMHGTITVTA